MVLAHIFEEKHRTQDVRIFQETTFDNMMLSANVLKGLTDSGFYKPSPIQLLGIPIGKLGLDLLLEAKSGTGKTAVFSVITLEKLNLKQGLQTIIVAPTREIAAQICDVLKQIGSKTEGLNVEYVIGGLPLKDDIEKLKNNVHILVGTPGRLKYLIQDKNFDTTLVRLLILDEADKLMESSFQDDIRYIHAMLPKLKQVIMSSATYPESAMEVINQLVQDAHHICLTGNKILLGISHRVTYVKCNVNSVTQTMIKFKELLKILSNIQFKQCVIFCKYQARVAQLHKSLTRANWPSELVYGRQEQTIRLDALKTLQEYKCRILISTDLVSRGIDAKNVDLVINFEPPDDCETYLHRIGRSGRYGSIGMAISILSEGTESIKFMDMLGSIKQSLEIKELWSEVEAKDDYNISQDEVVPKRDICIATNNSERNMNHDDFWNYLNFNDAPENVENFADLCMSYQNYNQVVESFEDLLHSYKNNESNIVTTHSDNYEYKTLSKVDLPLKEHFLTLKHLKEFIASNVIGSDTSLETNEINNTENNSILLKREGQNKSSYSLNNTFNYKDDCIDANVFAEQLPQCFQSSKNRKFSKHKSYNNNYENKFNIDEQKKTVSGNINRRDNCRKVTRELSDNNDSIDSSHTIYHHDDDTNYYQWYNRLKQRMQQLETSLYLEEMSKHQY